MRRPSFFSTYRALFCATTSGTMSTPAGVCADGHGEYRKCQWRRRAARAAQAACVAEVGLRLLQLVEEVRHVPAGGLEPVRTSRYWRSVGVWGSEARATYTMSPHGASSIDVMLYSSITVFSAWRSWRVCRTDECPCMKPGTLVGASDRKGAARANGRHRARASFVNRLLQPFVT